MPASSKTRFLEARSLEAFFLRWDTVYYWTFTFEEIISDKTEAERRFKPFRDLLSRRGFDSRHFWELQKRGSWHVHLVTNGYLDVVWLRSWMQVRGWGPMMKVKRVQTQRTWDESKQAWVRDQEQHKALITYLVKYLTKCLGEQMDQHKKLAGGTVRSKAGTTNFRWVPWIKAGAYLYAAGVTLFGQINGHPPTFWNVREVILLGYYDSGWDRVDPWYPLTG